MKGTVLDFMKLVAENPELARKLGELASEFDFEFTDDELIETDLEAVAGGALDTQDDMAQMDMLKLENSLNQQSQLMQVMSNIMKQQRDTSKAIVNNLK